MSAFSFLSPSTDGNDDNSGSTDEITDENSMYFISFLPPISFIYYYFLLLQTFFLYKMYNNKKSNRASLFIHDRYLNFILW